MEKKKYTQKEPNDLQQFCKKSHKFNKFASKWHQKRHQIIELKLEGFTLRLEAFKGQKKQAKTAPQVGQKDAKEEPWPHRVAKRVPKRNPNSLKMLTFGILVLKV